MSPTVPVRIPNTAGTQMPAVLLPYQQRWVADDAQLKIAEKSRRIGLTWAEAADDVLVAAADKSAGGQNVYYIGYNQDMAIEFVEACAMWARAFDRAASEMEEGLWEQEGSSGADKYIKTYTIRFPAAGHRIVALSSRPANLRGKQGVVVIDEAAFHDQLGELLKAALALLIWGGKVRVISTHNGDSNPFAELIKDLRARRRRGAVHKITFQEAVEEGLYERVCLRLDKPWTQAHQEDWVREVYAFYGDDAREELDVIPSHQAGAYLTRALIESRMVEAPVVRLEKDNDFAQWPLHLREAEIREWCDTVLRPLLGELNERREHTLGEDFGRSGDLTVLAPAELGQDLVRRVPFLVELRNIPFAQQRQIVFYIIDRLPRFLAGAFDARGNGQELAEAASDRYGSQSIHQVMLSDKFYGEHMPAFKAGFEDATIEIPRDADTLDDLRALQVINGVPKLPKSTAASPGRKQRHGDTAIALFLMWYASEQGGGEIGFVPVPRGGRWHGAGAESAHREDEEDVALLGSGAW